MNQNLKDIIESEIGIKIDGQLTLEEAKAIYAFIKPVLDMVFPHLDDQIDEKIDWLEQLAQSRPRARKAIIMAICGSARIAFKCPDDDDNKTQF
jgi:hypothetical protein